VTSTNQLPYLLPWVRVLIPIRDVRSTTWGHEAWPKIEPTLRRALEMRPADRAGWMVEVMAFRERE
jgi:hypothetical protein